MGGLLEVSRSFRAMNTSVEAVVCATPARKKDAEDALAEVERLFCDVQTRMSRFLPDSELSRLNAAAGQPFNASPLLFQLLQEAQEMARITDGAFDPTVLYNLRAEGYDRSFEEIREKNSPTEVKERPALVFNWRHIALDFMTACVHLPPGCGIDLGGIGKGWTVDQACRILERFPMYAIDAGGDIRIGGASASPWTIAVADPFTEGRDLMILSLREGAVCTSTTMRRCWGGADGMRHHIIDPRSGRSAKSGVVSSTVVAASAAAAEAIAKAAIVLGEEAGSSLIERIPGASGLLVLEDGRQVSTVGFDEYKA